MYVRRKYRTKRKPTTRRRRAAPKRRTAIARKVNVRGDTHFFRRMGYKATITGNPGAIAKGAMTFQISDIPNVAEFTNLFDYYKLTGVKLRFSLNLDPSAQAPSNAQRPRMFYAIDNDDSTVPTDTDELRQRGRCREWLHNPNKPLSLFIRPKYLNRVSYSAIQDGYQIAANRWLDLGVPNVPHYGFKYVIENINADIGQTILVDATYYLAFKGSR